MPKKILSWVLALLVISFSFISWSSVNRAIFSEDSGHFWMPLMWFSFFAVAISLGVVIIKEKIFRNLLFLSSLLLSLIFVHSLWHFVLIVFAWLFLFVAGRNINQDINDSIKINLLRSLPRGIFSIVIAFVLMVSSQYYFSVKNLDISQITPRISKGEVTIQAINFVLPKISPDFEEVKSEETSIDDFLGEVYETIIKKEEDKIKSNFESGSSSVQKDQLEMIMESELGRKLTDDEKRQIEAYSSDVIEVVPTISPQIKKEVVDEWKSELSKSTGFEIMGNEKVVDIFVSAVNYKINNFVKPKEGQKQSSVLPIFFSVVLFITLVSLGSVVSRIWTGITTGIFWILKKTKIVKIETVTKEAEIIQ